MNEYNLSNTYLEGLVSQQITVPSVVNMPIDGFRQKYRELADRIDTTIGNGNRAIDRAEIKRFLDEIADLPECQHLKKPAQTIARNLKSRFYPQYILWPVNYDIGLPILSENPEHIDLANSCLPVAKELLSKMPKSLVYSLREAGVSLIQTDREIDDLLYGVSDRDGNEEQRFAETKALYNLVTRQIIIRSDSTPREFYEQISHELGHAVDDVLGLSTSHFYETWYTDNIHQLSDYEQQEGIIGLRESFAERFKTFLIEPQKLEKEYPVIYEWFEGIFLKQSFVN